MFRLSVIEFYFTLSFEVTLNEDAPDGVSDIKRKFELTSITTMLFLMLFLSVQCYTVFSLKHSHQVEGLF